MEEILSDFETYFHPLQDIQESYVKDVLFVPRTHINLLSYNIFLRPPPVKNNEDDYKNERLADFIHKMKDYDIICLQEMFGSFNLRKQNLIKIAHKLGFFFHAEPPAPSFFSSFVVDGGLLILSRFPIVESEFLPFKYSVCSDSLSEKGVLFTKIKIKDSCMNLITTHLQASYFDSSEFKWKMSIITRIEQMKEMSSYINDLIVEKRVNPQETFLLCGDFNVDFHHFEKMKKQNKITLDSDVHEYESLLNNLNNGFCSKDLFTEKHKINPFTFGVNGDQHPNYDCVLIDKADFGSFQTLDYIFEISLSNDDESQKNLKINRESPKVEPFLIERRPYQQLSDHLGLTIELFLKS